VAQTPWDDRVAACGSVGWWSIGQRLLPTGCQALVDQTLVESEGKGRQRFPFRVQHSWQYSINTYDLSISLKEWILPSLE
ncbi:hypothetical protein, partial [Endozoicomonas sp. SESOKO2]|uniref:hypothetical protein n=1 Tax=Endozoicomonas sp. SESOKO2 TaxID=2828743 RepID=UPI002148138B